MARLLVCTSDTLADYRGYVMLFFSGHSQVGPACQMIDLHPDAFEKVRVRKPAHSRALICSWPWQERVRVCSLQRTNPPSDRVASVANDRLDCYSEPGA